MQPLNGANVLRVDREERGYSYRFSHAIPLFTKANLFPYLTLLLAFATLSLLAMAQDSSNTPTQEIVVNLAAGRVVIAVVKDAILIGTVENPIESGTHPPIPVQISSERAGVILGAVDWTSPSAQKDLARLDRELPHLRSQLGVGAPPPHLGESQGNDEASDIEQIGQNLLERLNELAAGFHAKIDLQSSEPIAELIVADFLANYGPEVWQLNYGLKQSQQRGDYWATSVTRPVYLQFYPPEKGQPHTLIEFNYPVEGAPPSLLSLLQNGDQRLARVKESDSKMAAVAGRFANGESNKAPAEDAIQFLRAALAAVSPPNSRQTMAEIQPESGLKWILAPTEPQQRVSPQPQRPPGAPTLVKPSSQ